MDQPLPLTHAEASGYRATSTHAQVLRFCADLVRLTPHVRCERLGTSGEGQPIHALVVSPSGAFTPAAADRKGLLKILVIANIHAGEVEGKEAVLMLARDLTVGGRPPAWLRKCVLVLIPDYNPDGNDRIDARHRALDLVKMDGQIGPPGGVGTRYTGKGINLNRDYMKQEAVESRVLSRAYSRWWPHLTFDCHTTDGSLHGYHLTYDTAHTEASGPRDPIYYVQTELLPEVTRRLSRRGIRTFFYGNYRDQQDPRKGWESYSALPRYGSHYRGLTGRCDVLLETYSYLPFDERVRVMYATLREAWQVAATQAARIRTVTARAEAQTIAAGDTPSPGDRVGITYGVATPAPGGRLAFRYPAHPYPDEVPIVGRDLATLRARKLGGRLVTYRTTYWGRYLPTRRVARPWAYVVPAPLVPRLRDHNIRVARLAKPATLDVERYVVLDAKRTDSPDVGSYVRDETVLNVRGEVVSRRLAAGTWLVPMAQPLAAVAICLLEPESDDGLARWDLLPRRLRRGDEFPVLRIGAPARLTLRAGR